MSFGIWELAIILAIVALLFGTKKLRTIGADIGGAIKGLRAAMREEDAEEKPPPPIIEGEAKPAADKEPGPR